MKILRCPVKRALVESYCMCKITHFLLQLPPHGRNQVISLLILL